MTALLIASTVVLLVMVLLSVRAARAREWEVSGLLLICVVTASMLVGALLERVFS